MPAYWIARAKVLNPESYGRYAEQVPGIWSRFGARVLARAGKFHLAEASDRFNRFVVVEFPTMEAAIACYESPEYQAARVHRVFPHGDAEIVILDGGEAPSTLTSSS